MSAFAADWLALREPYDLRARNKAVLDALTEYLAERDAISVVDLACGLGANLRALAPHLPRRQSWRLVDNDLSLLARAAPQAMPADTIVVTTPVDLAYDLEAALDGPVELVTTSALLDLVSSEWLNRLAVESAARRLPVYAALTYDGRVTLDPADPQDTAIVASLNRHQRRDKGFGPALGPDAATAAAADFEKVGYVVVEGRSDWVLGPQDRDIQHEVISGWAAAARDVGDVSFAEIVAWLARRRAALAAGTSSMRVGHVDIFARPTGTR